MNTSKELKSALVSVFILILCFGTSCSKYIEPNVTNNVQTIKTMTISEMEILSGLPFSSKERLRSASLEDHGVDFNLSRKAALVELKDFNDLFLSIDERGSFKLSERAVILKDAIGNTKFYEYIVFNKDGKAIGTITNFAKKETNDFSAYVLPYVREYEDNKSLIYSDTYPYNPTEGELRSAKLEKEVFENNAQTEDFWNKAEAWGNSFSDTKDENVVKQEEFRGWFDTSTAYHTIPEFDRDNLQRTCFSGWCAPGALAWVYRAYYDYYNGHYIPLHGEPKNSDNNIQSNGSTSIYDKYNCEILKKFNEYVGMDIFGLGLIEIDGAVDPWKFDRLVSEFFPNHKIYTDHSIKVLKGAPRRAIKANKPVYLVVLAGDQLHYLIGFGTKDKYGWFGFHYDSWIKVMDNGATIKDHGYMPYYRSSHFFKVENKFIAYGEFVRK